MKEKLVALWSKIVDNKDVVIRVGSAFLGAALGLGIATLVANEQEDTLYEEIDDSEEDLLA